MHVPLGLIALITALGTTLPSAPADDFTDSPLYASWAKLKPGSSITLSVEMMAMGQDVKTQVLQKLTEVAPEQLIVETTMTSPGRTVGPTKVAIKAKVPKDEADRTRLPPGMKGQTKELADETVEAGGKSYKCKVTEFVGELQGGTTKGKIWSSDEVPGGMVRTEMTTEGKMASTITSKLVAIDLK